MRIAELSETTGVSVATIKYYIREGLLPAGVPTARNQARYDRRHVERLELIRALREGAGLPIATLSRVFAVMDEHRPTDRPAYLSTAIGALSDPPGERRDDAASARAPGDVDELLAHLGWDVDADSPGRADLVRSVAAVHRFLPGLIGAGTDLAVHARVMRDLADVELPDAFDPDADPAGSLRLAVLGTVLFEPVLTALRKLAHVDRLRTLTTGDDSAGAVAAERITMGG